MVEATSFEVEKSPPFSAKILSLVFGKRFRDFERFDPRPDQVVAFEPERPELDIPSSSLL